MTCHHRRADARCHEAIVVGAGPAGTRHVAGAGCEPASNTVVLERGDRVGHTWAQPLRQPRPAHRQALVRAARHGVPVAHAALSHRVATSSTISTATPNTFQPADRDIRRCHEDRATRGSLGAPTAHRRALESTDARRRHGHRREPMRTSDSRTRSIRRARDAQRRVPAAGTRSTGQRVLIVGAGNSAGERFRSSSRGHGATVTLAVQYWRDHRASPAAGHSDSVPVGPRQSVAPTPSSSELTTAVGALRGPRVLPPPSPTACPRCRSIGLALADALRAGTIRLQRWGDAFTAGGGPIRRGAESRLTMSFWRPDIARRWAFSTGLDPHRPLWVWRPPRPRRQPRPARPVFRRSQLRHAWRPCTTSLATRDAATGCGVGARQKVTRARCDSCANVHWKPARTV